MILLVDIGNTRLKWTQQKAGKLCQVGAITHRHTNIKSALLIAWQDLQAPQKICLV